jgi:hypothetical protein
VRTALPARYRSALLLAAPVLTAVALTAGCSSSASEGAPTQSAAGDAGSMQSKDSPEFAPAAVDSSSGGGADAGVQQRAVISTGRIELVSDDAVLAREGGRIADENTVTDERGTVTRSQLVLRVPSDRFAPAMTSLGDLATLRSSSRKAEDVTTRVIDVDARIAAQRAGVRRLRHLVSRAANLPALLAVERELTAPQGELESLLQQRAYLADQTSLATIDVDVTRQTTPSPATRSTGGFVGGLSHGWHALVTVVVAVLVAVGAVLPFAVAGIVVGLPVWLVGRRFRRTPEPEAPVET